MPAGIPYPDGHWPRNGDTVTFMTEPWDPVRVTGEVVRVYAPRKGTQKIIVRVPGGQAYGPDPCDVERYTSGVAFVAHEQEA